MTRVAGRPRSMSLDAPNVHVADVELEIASTVEGDEQAPARHCVGRERQGFDALVRTEELVEIGPDADITRLGVGSTGW
jgi:hypothetical protein